jgi:hypothetical protein
MPFTPADKLIIQQLVLEEGFGAYRIKRKYPQKPWSPSGLDKVVKKIRETRSIERKSGSGRPRSARTVANVSRVREIVNGSERGTLDDASTRKIALRLRTSRSSVQRILKRDLHVHVYKHERTHYITQQTAQQRVARCAYLGEKVTLGVLKRICWTVEIRKCYVISLRSSRSLLIEQSINSVLQVRGSDRKLLPFFWATLYIGTYST